MMSIDDLRKGVGQKLTARNGQSGEAENGRAQQRTEGQGAPAPTVQEKDQDQIGWQFRHGCHTERQKDTQTQIGCIAGVAVVNNSHQNPTTTMEITKKNLNESFGIYDIKSGLYLEKFSSTTKVSKGWCYAGGEVSEVNQIPCGPAHWRWPALLLRSTSKSRQPNVVFSRATNQHDGTYQQTKIQIQK